LFARFETTTFLHYSDIVISTVSSKITGLGKKYIFHYDIVHQNIFSVNILKVKLHSLPTKLA